MKSTIVTAALVAAVSAQQSAYGQCGGSGYTGPTSCVAGYSCVSNGAYYAQCTPAASVAASSTAKASTTSTAVKASSTAAAPTTTAKATSTAAAPSSSKPPATSSAAAPASSGKVAYAGVNIAGCDFGIDTSGNAGTPSCPTTVGATQMQHFTSQDGLVCLLNPMLRFFVSSILTTFEEHLPYSRWMAVLCR